MRKIIHFAALLAFLVGATAFRVNAQSQTTVTAIVTDPNGVPYAGGTVKAVLSPAGVASPCVVTAENCVPIPGTVGPQSLDNNGAFTMNLYPNASILCGGQACATQWTFTVCIAPGAAPPLGTGPQCFSLAQTIAGGSQNISVALSGVAPRLSNITGGGGGGGSPGAPAGSVQTNLGGTAFGGSSLLYDPVANSFSGSFTFDFSGITLINLPAFLNTNAATASALQTTPNGCAIAGQFATGISAAGNAICSAPTGSGTVNSGSALQPAAYLANGTAVSPVPFPGTIPNGTFFNLQWLSNNSGAISSVSMASDALTVNPQTGAGYTLQSSPVSGNSDLESLVTLSNAAPQQFNFCNLGVTAGCGQGFLGALENLGTAAWTLKPSGTQTVNGGASLNFSEFTYAPFVADTTTDWRVVRMPTIDKLDTEAGNCMKGMTWNNSTETYGCSLAPFSALTAGTNTNTGLFDLEQPGVFTLGQMNQSFLTGLNSCNSASIFQTEEGPGKVSTDASATCIAVPSSGVTNAFTVGYHAYMTTSAPSSGCQFPSVGCPSIGFAFDGISATAGANLWAWNSVISSTVGAATRLTGIEDDITTNNAGDTGQGIYLGMFANAQSGIPAIFVQSTNAASGRWNEGLVFDPGSLNNSAYAFVPSGLTLSARNSGVAGALTQGITFKSLNNSSALVYDQIYGIVDAQNNLELNIAGISGTTPYLTVPAIRATGTPNVTGCSLTSLAGGASAGQFHSGTAGTCTVTVTPGITAMTGWACLSNDLTTTTDIVKQTASTTTTATLSGTTANGDLVNYACTAY